MDKYNKHYKEKGRNGWTPSNTSDSLLITEPEAAVDMRVPHYYRGRNGYEARKVCDNFELPYHLATATTYILRAYHKHDTPVDCITKAIAHLEFELEKIRDVGE
jgi:hypothetical protein